MSRPETIDPTTHPALESLCQQFDKRRTLISHISVSTVDRLTQTLGYSTLSIDRHTVGGVINMIYFVKVQKTQLNVDELVEVKDWVLRVTNPWSRWQGCLPRNETTVLDIISRWNATCGSAELQIPAPKILSFSYDAATSILGCEYTLAEKLPGKNANLVIPQLDVVQREVLWKDFLRILSALQLIPPELAFAGQTEDRVKEYTATIGSFCRWPDAMGPILRDGPLIGPIGSACDLQLEALDRALLDLAQSDTVPDALEPAQIERLMSRIKKLVEKVRSGEVDGDRMWPTDLPLALTHNDLHGGNMLVDPESGRITGILDWDGVHWGFSRDMANEWSSALASDLFIDAALLEAEAEVERRWPSTLNMKLRSEWGAISHVATYLTNYNCSWLGDPPPLTGPAGVPVNDPINLEPLYSVHKSNWKECMKLLDNLDLELALGDNAFTTAPEYPSDSEDDKPYEEPNQNEKKDD